MTNTAIALLRAVKDQSRVGPGGRPVRRSKRVSYPSALFHSIVAFLHEPEKPCFEVSDRDLQALSDRMHGRSSIRFNPDSDWTAQDHLELQGRIDAELDLRKARV